MEAVTFTVNEPSRRQKKIQALANGLEFVGISNEVTQDYCQGFLNWRLWSYMAFADIRRRYRRTIIGPFWTTLSLAIFIISMGILFSALWKMDIKSFLPYFGSGFVCWTFVSSLITDGCSTFTSAEGLLKQINLPYSSFAWLIVARNFLVFLHQIVIFLGIALIFHVSINRYTLLMIPGFLLLFITGSWLTILLGMFCARYRDLQQVVSSLLQISMFVTPIFWPESQLGQGIKSYVLINGNPLYHYVSVIRQPLLGLAPSYLSWIVVSFSTILGLTLTLMLMSKKYRQIVFWL